MLGIGLISRVFHAKIMKIENYRYLKQENPGNLQFLKEISFFAKLCLQLILTLSNSILAFDLTKKLRRIEARKTLNFINKLWEFEKN